MVTHDRYLLDNVCNKVGELKDGKLDVFSGTYSEMKGAVRKTRKIEGADVYKVISTFTEWTSRKKYRAGDKIHIAESELGKFEWALDNGKLKRSKGGKLKVVEK